METRTLLVGCILGAALVGCSAGAQVVRQDGRGGELVTWGPVVPAGEQARAHMVSHCAGRYTVTIEAKAAEDGTRRVTYACARGMAMLDHAASASVATIPMVGALETP